ncbi:MAG: PAS-domain containing protein [Paracoccaceae bacterium]
MALAEWLLLLAICLAAAQIGVFLPRWLEFRTAGQRPERGRAMLHGGQSQAIDDVPIAVWQTDKDGNVTWGNAQYRHLVEVRATEPDKPIFPPSSDDTKSEPLRAALYSAESDSPEWFDVSRVARDNGHLHFAQNVSCLVGMEHSRRDFFHTMAATFAQLSTGLAIFDKGMRLHLFNPAFVEMSGLPVEFLSSRPDIATFFDRMRDTRSMPEPRDYSAWRSEISELARAASEGRYQETWSLPSGAVYQVSGQPHPGGAIAFLFEDISAEVSLARQFRSELESSQTALDMMDEAVCMFSASGKMTYANPAYRQFWSIAADRNTRGETLKEASAEWASLSRGTLPADFLDHVDQAPHSSPVFVRPGKKSGICVAVRLTAGDLLIRFRDHAPVGQKVAREVEPA